MIPPASRRVPPEKSFNGTESGTEFPGRCLYAHAKPSDWIPFDKDEEQNAPECQHEDRTKISPIVGCEEVGAS